MFYIKLADFDIRKRFISEMKVNGIVCPFHYVPLHSSPAGKKFSRFHGQDNYTTSESEKLVRLPLYFNMSDEEVSVVIDCTVAIVSKLR